MHKRYLQQKWKWFLSTHSELSLWGKKLRFDSLIGYPEPKETKTEFELWSTSKFLKPELKRVYTIQLTMIQTKSLEFCGTAKYQQCMNGLAIQVPNEWKSDIFILWQETMMESQLTLPNVEHV